MLLFLPTNDGLQLSGDSFLEDSFDPTGSEEFALEKCIKGELVMYEGTLVSPGLKYSAQDHLSDGIGPYFHLRHCEACIFVYDVGNRASFDAVKWYYENLSHERSLERLYCDVGCSPVCKPRPPYLGSIFVIANKFARNEGEWATTRQEGEDLCASIGATFFPMSCKTGEGGGRVNLESMTFQILLKRAQVAAGKDTDALLSEASSPWSQQQVRNAVFWHEDTILAFILTTVFGPQVPAGHSNIRNRVGTRVRRYRRLN